MNYYNFAYVNMIHEIYKSLVRIMIMKCMYRTFYLLQCANRQTDREMTSASFFYTVHIAINSGL